MNETLKSIYIDVLERGGQISEYCRESNGDIVVVMRFFSAIRYYSCTYKLTPAGRRKK